MKVTTIFQALEDRGDDEAIVQHGPYFCSRLDENGQKKTGIKDPWLGEGYYFWDSSLEDAQWWGRTIYKENHYVVFSTQYDQHSNQLLDLLGNLDQMHDFFEIARLIMQRRNLSRISFPVVIEYLKSLKGESIKAVRACPMNKEIFTQSTISFPGGKFYLPQLSHVQICFFDTALLDLGSWKKVYPSSLDDDMCFVR